MAQIHLSNLETHSYRADMVSGRYSGPGQAEESNNPDPLPAEELQRNNACTEVEDLSSNGSWPQTSISRSLQRAEALLRTTFNPSFKWLLRKCSQEDEEEEEGSFVATHNLVSRSSARLLRLQQGMLNISPQRLLVRESEVLLQVCVKGTSQEGCIVQQQQPSLQGCYRALWSLLEQRSQLLFVHEYGRRVRSAVAYMSRLTALLEGELRRPDLMLKQNPFTSFSFKVVPLSQELCVHLNHWSCLSSKARSDAFLRPALARQTYMLVQMRRTLGSLGLQALLLMENCVYAILSALAQTHIESIPRETLEDILTATELYNQMFEEHKSLHSATQWKNGALQRKCYSRLPVLQSARSSQPSTFQVKELLKVVAVYHGNMAAIELHHWASSGNNQIQPNHQVLPRPEARLQSQQSVRTGWTWERLEHTYYPLGSHDTHSAPSLFLPPLLHPVQLCNPSTDRPGSSGRGSVHDRPGSSGRGSVHDRPGSSGRGSVHDRPGSSGRGSVHDRPGSSGRGSVHDRPGSSERGSVPNSSQTPGHSSAVPLKAFCQQDQSSLELLFQAMMSSSELLAPLVPHTPTPELLASTPELPVLVTRTEVIGTNVQTDVVVSQGGRADGKPAPPKRQRTEQLQHKCFKKGYQDQMEPAASCPSSGDRCPGDDPAKERGEGQEFLLRPRSVKWLDLGHSSVCTDLFGEYRATLWSICSQALWQYFHFPPDGAVGSINLWSDHEKFQLLHTFRQASMADLVPKECRAMLEKFCLRLLVGTAHTHWDHVLCCSLGSGLKDKCLPGSSRERRLLMTSPERDGSPVITATVKLLLRLSPPLLSSIRSHHLADSIKTGPSSQALCRTTASLALGSVQASMIWVMSKAYQFLSSWSLDRFLLITQGDLQALRVSLERLLQHMETLMADGSDVVSHHHHHHVLLSQHVGVLRRAVSQLQDFSSVVLKIFSSGCKQMSGKIFEQTMPSAKHWRLNYNTEFPSSPSEYASMAAQTVIGQVLEGVAPLSDDARVQALSVTMTAFMEAWMEHILKQKIKFSVQGALQLKQDFNLIRELIQSDQYSLSDDLHQRLLNLRVFQQVDSAVVCLLQQPQAKPYLQSSGWEPFRRCCPTMSSRSSVDVAIGGSITNLENMEGEVLTLTPDAPQAPPTSPGQTYMAPSLALGAAQQEWLDLRIHNSAPRWRLPGLQCLFKSEP